MKTRKINKLLNNINAWTGIAKAVMLQDARRAPVLAAHRLVNAAGEIEFYAKALRVAAEEKP